MKRIIPMQSVPVSVSLLLLVLLYLPLLSLGQKPVPRQKTGSKDEVQEVKLPVTREMEQKVIALVQPVKEKLEQVFKSDGSGMYAGYQQEMKRLGEMRDPEKQKALISKIQEKYYPFIRKSWQKAGIDENDYQQKLRNIFPPELKETIRFGEFLSFTMSSPKPSPAPPPPPPPAPVCIDATNNFFNLERKTLALNSNGSATLSKNYGTVGTGAAVAGRSTLSGWLLSDITIPGTFADDGKNLRITKTYTWRAYATAFSVLGCAFATISTSTDNFSSDVFIRCWAPVTWFSNIERNEVRTVQTIVNKRFLLNIRFGINIYADAFAEIAAGGTAGSTYDNVMWSACEQ